LKRQVESFIGFIDPPDHTRLRKLVTALTVNWRDRSKRLLTNGRCMIAPPLGYWRQMYDLPPPPESLAHDPAVAVS
jgi:hypothetical protein